MKIQEMIEAIKNGKKVRRERWSGGKFLYYVPSASYPAMTDIAKSILLIKTERFFIKNILLFDAKMVMLGSIPQLSVMS